MEHKGWFYYSLQEKHLYYNDTGSYMRFKFSENVKCLGYEHINHALETWEYVNVNGWKKLLHTVYIPEENIFMPYLELIEASPELNFATIYKFNKHLYQALDYLRHAQYCRSKSVNLNMMDYNQLYKEAFEKIIEREMDDEGFPTNSIFLGNDRTHYILKDQQEFATDAMNRLI